MPQKHKSKQQTQSSTKEGPVLPSPADNITSALTSTALPTNQSPSQEEPPSKGPAPLLVSEDQPSSGSPHLGASSLVGH